MNAHVVMLEARIERLTGECERLRAALQAFACTGSWRVETDRCFPDDPAWLWVYTYEWPMHVAQQALGHMNGEGCGCAGCRDFGGALLEPIDRSEIDNRINPGTVVVLVEPAAEAPS